MSTLSRRQVRRRDFSSRPWDPIRHNRSVALRRATRAANRRLRELTLAFLRLGRVAEEAGRKMGVSDE